MAKKTKKKFDWDNLRGMLDNEGFEYYFTKHTTDVFKGVDPKLHKLEKAFVKAANAFEKALDKALEKNCTEEYECDFCSEEE